MKAIIPLDPQNLGGDSHTLDESYFEVLAERDKTVLIEFHSIIPPITWVENFDLMYCQRQHDLETIKVIRKATDEERKKFRVPLWIQGDDVPVCCGKPMYFVGQIDDDHICTERPPDAKLWWHDAASFYVFTCSQCLGVKAEGQQF
jgi:hypothetical protein